MVLLIIIFTIIYIVLAFKRLDWAVMVLVAGLPFYLIRFTVLSIPMTILELMILISFSFWILTNGRQIVANLNKARSKKFFQRRDRYPFDIEIILLLVISFIAVAVAGFSESALGIWKAYFFEPVLVFILVLNVFNAKKIIKSGSNALKVVEPLLWPLTVSALVVSLVAIYQKTTGQLVVTAFWPRVTGVFPYPNALGLFLGPITMLMLGWLLNNFQFSPGAHRAAGKAIFNFQIKSLKNWLVVFTIILTIIAIYLARSEGALIGIAAAIVFFIGFTVGRRAYKHSLVRKLELIGFSVILVVAMLYPAIALNIYPPYYYPNTGNKYLNYALDKLMLKDISGEIRKQQWRETWAMMTASPARFLLGTGLDNYRETITPYHQPGIFYNFEHDPDFRRKIVWFDEKYKAQHWQPVEIYMYPHSFLLNFWTELGLLGSLLFLWIVVKYTINGFKGQPRTEDIKSRYLYAGLVGAMMVITLHGIVDVPYFKNDLAVMFWLLIAMISMVRLAEKENAVVKK